MNWFKKKEENALVVKKPVVVEVADIKQYLVNEYERVDKLRQRNEELELQLEQARELKFKYDAALVTLDEYKKRLERADQQIVQEKQRTEFARNETAKAKDELNSYKIILHDAALTKEAIQAEIVLEYKNNLVENINAVKGNLSKGLVAKIVNETELCSTKKGGGEG